MLQSSTGHGGSQIITLGVRRHNGKHTIHTNTVYGKGTRLKKNRQLHEH